MFDYIWAIVVRVDWMALILVTLVGVITYSLYKAHTDPTRFDLRTVIQKDDGTVSIHKMGQLTALIVSTWAFVYLVLHDKLEDTYFLTYMGVWASTEILNKVANRVQQPPPPQPADPESASGPK